jgi:hypothetical protein
MKIASVLVIFKKSLSDKEKSRLRTVSQYEVVVAPSELQQEIHALGHKWINLEELVEAGSIYEARAFLEELSRTTLPDGTRITKTFIYEGYELWWMYYNKLFLYSCLPYTQYKRLLTYLSDFENVYIYEPPYRDLFSFYFQAYGTKVQIVREPVLKSSSVLPLGVLVQMFVTLASLPFLMVQRHHLMVFTGDTFEKGRDYDFRMKFIYEELRQRSIPFVEFIRSLESWKTVLQHAFVRRRPVVYLEGIAMLGRWVSVLTYGRSSTKNTLRTRIFSSEVDSDTHFKLLLTSQFLLNAYDDVWAIRITRLILRLIGIRAAYITAAAERTFHAVIGCKLNKIPTVGILHGVASRHYNVYDFLPTYDGEKSLSVDTYGVWSEWWKEYYLENGNAYSKEQLVVSGPMRPLVAEDVQNNWKIKHDGPLRVLFVSEQLAVPEEVLPYLEALMNTKGISVYMKFRPYRDGFELWLRQYHREILSVIGEDKILRGGMQEAIAVCDMVVGSHSTAVLEALLVEKPMVFFATNKWGDYFSLKGYHSHYIFYAENKNIPVEILNGLKKRFFGDPYQNGSKWVVSELVSAMNRN